MVRRAKLGGKETREALPIASPSRSPHCPHDLLAGDFDQNNVPVEHGFGEGLDDPCGLVSDGLENGQYFSNNIAGINGESRGHLLNGLEATPERTGKRKVVRVERPVVVRIRERLAVVAERSPCRLSWSLSPSSSRMSRQLLRRLR
jgi:hypothetical protein